MSYGTHAADPEVLAAERDEARAALKLAQRDCDDLVLRHGAARRDLDEARAIARRYRKTHRDCRGGAFGGQRVTDQRCATCVRFDALAWATADAEPAA